MPTLNTIDYHSSDLAALSPEEKLIWSGESVRPRGGCMRAAKLALFAMFLVVIVSGIAWAIFNASTAGMITAITFAIALGVALLGGRDAMVESPGGRQVRFTDRRLVAVGIGSKPPVQMSHAELASFSFSFFRRGRTVSRCLPPTWRWTSNRAMPMRSTKRPFNTSRFGQPTSQRRGGC